MIKKKTQRDVYKGVEVERQREGGKNIEKEKIRSDRSNEGSMSSSTQ